MSKVQARPSWDDYFLEILTPVKARASCPRRQGGAVLVDKLHRLVSTGYNGPPSKLANCSEQMPCPGFNEESGDTRLCVALHAEHNAIFFAGDRVDQADTLYCTTAPCRKCALEVLQTPIRRVVYQEPYADTFGLQLLMAGGVVVEWKGLR